MIISWEPGDSVSGTLLTATLASAVAFARSPAEEAHGCTPNSSHPSSGWTTFVTRRPGYGVWLNGCGRRKVIHGPCGGAWSGLGCVCWGMLLDWTN